MFHLLRFRNKLNPRYSMRALSLGLILLLATSITAIVSNYAEAKSATEPDVLVLVLSGLGLTDKLAINYKGDVPRTDIQKDLSVISDKTGWQIRNLVITEPLKSASQREAVTTTRFEIISVVDTKRGLLPIEPFILALKRFKLIQINYLVPSSFSFNGLSNYEDDNVKITLTGSGSSYMYRIYVKRNNFDILNLPRTQAEYVQKLQASERVSHQKRIFFAVGLAIICALAAYFIAVKLTNRQRPA